jgi:hypothetical protein
MLVTGILRNQMPFAASPAAQQTASPGHELSTPQVREDSAHERGIFDQRDDAQRSMVLQENRSPYVRQRTERLRGMLDNFFLDERLRYSLENCHA